jgi:hypothetical protein
MQSDWMAEGGFGKNVRPHLGLDISLVRLIERVKTCIQGVELVEVAMTANRGTGTAIGSPFPVIQNFSSEVER